MENESKSMNAEECLAVLNAGGWVVTGGREGLAYHRIHVKEASLVEGKIRVVTMLGHYEAPAENIVSSDSGQRIMILGSYTKQEQKKLLDGGGWREVEYTAPALKFQTLASLIEADHAREEKQKRVEEELKKWREEQERQRAEKARLQEEAREAARHEFAAKLTSEYVGKKIMKIEVIVDYICLEFEDGSKLSVELDGGDICDAWINVNGISLHHFKRVSG